MKNIDFLEKNGVDIKSSLEFFGDIESYNETVKDYLESVNTKLQQLIKFLQARDLPNYSIYVHSLKSDSKYYGFNKLADMAYNHELKSKEGDLEYVNAHFNELASEANNTITLLKEYITGDSKDEEINQSNNLNQSLVYNNKTILVVDDSNIIRNFVKRIFSEEYNVAGAEDGVEAIQIINANKDNDMIEAILLDLNMPKLDGFGVLDFMNQNNLLKKMPVSIISGDSSKETIDKAFQYQIVDMLTKPFTEQNVKMVIEKTLIYKGIK